jgi:hypothetical protein
MQWVRKGLRVIRIVALLAAVGCVLYAAGRFTLQHWGAILLAVYGAGGLLLLASDTIVKARMPRAGNLDDRLLALMGEIATRQQSAFMRFRLAIFSVLRAVCASMSWPAGVFVAVQRSIRTKGAMRARVAMNLSLLAADGLTVEPRAMLIAILLTTGALALSIQQAWYALVFCAAAAVYVTLLCSEVTVSPLSLAVRLRRASGYPYRTALILAAVTGAILTLSYADLHAQGFPTGGDIIAAVKGLYSQLDSVKRIFHGENVSRLELAQGISGALLVSAVIHGLLSFQEFQRTDEDLVALGNAKLSLGRAAEALDALGPIRDPSVSSLSVQAAALVGVNQTARAVQAWRRRSELAGGSSALTNEQVARTLLQTTVMMYPLSSSSLLALLKHWLQFKPAEWMVCMAVVQLCGMGRVKVDEMIAELNELDPNNVAYPVAAAELRLQKREAQKAAELAARAPQTDEILEYSRSTTLLWAGALGNTTKEQNRQTLEEWCDHNLAPLTDIAGNLDDVGEIGYATTTIYRVEQFATLLESSHLEAIRFLSSTLVARLKRVAPDKDAAQVVLDHFLQPQLANPHL